MTDLACMDWLNTLLPSNSAGLSLGIVSSHTISLELEAGKLNVLDVEDMPIIRHWYLVHRSDKALSPIAQAFSNYLLSRNNHEDIAAERQTIKCDGVT
ncbi:LysR substrate-binding domain-containing protein [Grimontia sedimenti]|uniref:LysR substrate-binding domain-containing protein n=1 Tax=Grimontia sedimenti TaxID=2711294 RepID=UPI001F42ECAB|nr:LysR substrate-binding domain-containing protein [Grimontia sedimenti]